MNRVKSKNYNLFRNVLFVYKGVAKHKPYLIGLLFLSIFSTIGTRFVWLYLSKYVIEYISDGIQIYELVRMVITLTVINILCMLGQNAVNFGKEPAALYVRPMFMLERNKRHMAMMYENLEYDEILDVIQKSKNATSWTERGIEGLIRFSITFLSDIFTCIVAVIILSRANPIMILVVVLFGILSYISIDKASNLEKKLVEDGITYEKRKNSYFNEASRDFAYGKDIRLYHCEDKLIDTQYELNKIMHTETCKAKNNWIKSGIFTSSLDMIREGFMYVVLIFSIIKRNLSIGNFTLYVGCVRNFAQALHNVLTTYARMRQCNREVNDYRTFNEFCSDEENEGVEVEYCDKYEIRFENVSFKYPSSESYALKDMNIVIDPFQKLAVVGLNGAGKTTFIKLLLRLYEPTKGTIYLNGVNVCKYNRKSYYSIFAPVFQDMECYAFTLSENVSMKTGEETDKLKVEKCLKDAGLGNKLDEWENGVDTHILKVLHNDGIILSGGEKQKMSLARALYKDSPIVILDEPTAALDAMAENKLYEDFNNLVNKKMAIYISHRLASTRFCDKIAMFDNGKMIEYGSHDELMTESGKYAQMYDMQSRYYKEDVVNG